MMITDDELFDQWRREGGMTEDHIRAARAYNHAQKLLTFLLRKENEDLLKELRSRMKSKSIFSSL